MTNLKFTEQDLNDNQLLTPRQSVGELEAGDKSVACPQDADGNESADSSKKPSVSNLPGPSTSRQNEGEKKQTLGDYLADNSKVRMNGFHFSKKFTNYIFTFDFVSK